MVRFKFKIETILILNFKLCFHADIKFYCLVLSIKVTIRGYVLKIILEKIEYKYLIYN
jgi:hypothetical protein